MSHEHIPLPDRASLSLEHRTVAGNHVFEPDSSQEARPGQKAIEAMEALTCEYFVPAMHCASCGMLLEALEDDLPGVTRVDADVRRQRVTIRYQPHLVNEEAIRAAALAEGYELRPSQNT